MAITRFGLHLDLVALAGETLTKHFGSIER